MGGYTLLNYLFSQLTRSLGVFFRTIRAFFSRKLVSITARLRRLTSFSRNAMKVATGSLQAAATAMKKPTKRDDYVETERLFISKAFLIKLLLVLAALGLIFYFLVWPFILSHFMTVKFYVEDSRVADWTGQVIVYADKDKTLPLYAGRLEDGVLQGVGEEYDENGLISYEGPFLDGQRSGEGVAYEDGVLAYWEQSERQAALEENLTRVNEQLADAQAQLAMGNGSQATVDDLESQRNALESAIQSCQAQRSLAKLQGQSMGVESVSAYNLGDTLILFDPADVDAAQLSLAATAWAQATGGDESQAELNMMTALVNLTEAYSNVQTALRSYETAAAAVQSAAGTYATGSGTKTAWYAALSAQADARMALCSALASFARGANQFNTLTGGWVSRSQDWFNETLEPMFQAVIQAAPEEEPEQGQEETPAEDPTNPEDPAAGGTEAPEEEPAVGEPTEGQTEDGQTEPDQPKDQTAADAAA